LIKNFEILEHDNALLPPYFKDFPIFEDIYAVCQARINSALGGA